MDGWVEVIAQSIAEIQLLPVWKNKRPPYWNSTSGFDFDHTTAVGMSFCTSLRNFIQIGPPITAEKWRHVDFQDGGCPASWILWVQQWVLWKDHVSSIENIVLNCLVFFLRKSRFYVRILATDSRTDGQTDKRTDGQAQRIKPPSLSRAAA